MSEPSDENVVAAYQYLDAHPEDDGVEWEEGVRMFQLSRGGVPRQLFGDEAERRREAMAALL